MKISVCSFSATSASVSRSASARGEAWKSLSSAFLIFMLGSFTRRSVIDGFQAAPSGRCAAATSNAVRVVPANYMAKMLFRRGFLKVYVLVPFPVL